MARYIRDRGDWLTGRCVLHIAPEYGIARLLRRRTEYIGLDLHPERFPGAVRGDVTALPFSEEFDAIICSHVLEHIPDDTKAMRSIYGALKPGGTALIEVPTYGEMTYERAGLSAGEREAEYGCPDHFRLNGRDFAQRLEAAGFSVEIVTPDDLPGDWLDRSVRTPHTESDWLLFVARKHHRFASAEKVAAEKLTA